MHFPASKVSGYNHPEWVGMLRFRQLGQMTWLLRIFKRIKLALVLGEMKVHMQPWKSIQNPKIAYMAIGNYQIVKAL